MSVSARLRRFIRAFLAVSVCAVWLVHAEGDAAKTAARDPAALENIEQFALANGLRVVVQADRTSPVVAISVVYHVGSRDEREGRTGFAHLFEHLMFAGTKNFDRPFAQALTDAGALQVNAATWSDHTSFYETVPSNALELALFLESERMGFLGPAITEKKLKSEIGVVLSEKRLKESNPYGSVEYPILAAVFPPPHPYRWSPLGTVDDLEAASIEDVRDWFSTHYRPDNAVISLVGDVDVATVRKLVEKYFGALKPGGPRVRLNAWVPKMAAPVSAVQIEPAPNARIYRAWAGPGRALRARTDADVLVAYLGQGEQSVLHRALVQDAGLASFVSFSVIPFEAASLVTLVVNLRPGADIAKADAIVDRVLADARNGKIDAGGLSSARTRIRAGLLTGLEQVGGPGGRAETLSFGVVYAGDPRNVATQARWIAATTPQAAASAARNYLTEAHYRLHVVPAEAKSSATADADRSLVPPVGTPPTPTFPTVERQKLENGLEVVVARRMSSPVVAVELAFAAGYAADPKDLAGLSNLSTELLIAGGPDLKPSARAAELGATLTSRTSVGSNGVRVIIPAEAFGSGVALLGAIAKRPLPSANFDAVRAQQAAAAAREAADPYRLATRVLAETLYGSGHPYAVAASGRGRRGTVQSATLDDAQAFRQSRFRPENARLVVVGPLSLNDVVASARKSFGDWRIAGASADPVKLGEPNVKATARVLIVDRPSAAQTMIAAGSILEPAGSSPRPADGLVLELLGGSGGSRLTRNLREEKGWSYWTRALASSVPGPRMLIVAAPSQRERAVDALREMAGEIAAIASRGPKPRPPSDEEVRIRVQRGALAYAGRFITSESVLDELVQNSDMGRADDFSRAETVALKDVKTPDAGSAAAKLFSRNMVWVVVGDRSRLEQPLSTLGLGPVEVVEPPN